MCFHFSHMFTMQARASHPGSGGHITKGAGAATPSGQRSLFCLPSPRFDPKPLPLHDVPQLPQIGLGDDVIGFELERAQVVVLRFGKFPIQVEDGTEVHQSSRVLKRAETRSAARSAISAASPRRACSSRNWPGGERGRRGRKSIYYSGVVKFRLV
ncbi:hypothetical protein EYF80_045199 [Liparis tanakae]|uniref:Uncharacterized protein n=1 Tax=Liparis tanakae TaxID=230148 RepID=A0A4Z2FTJ8_9TELE|nr:hypothetical protein EYF80_045199 [Liparis tanakae]